MKDLMGDIPAWALEDSDSDNGGDGNGASSGGGGGGGGGDDVPDWAKEPSTKKEKKKKKKSSGGDIEMGDVGENKYMTTFFKEVDDINADIKAVSKASKDIEVINEKSMRATTTAEEKMLSEKLGPLISSTNKRAKRTKTLLGLLKEETAKLKGEGKLNASDVRYVSDSM